MLSLMNEGHPYGHLADKRGPLTPKTLAEIERIPINQCLKLLKELRTNQVFSKTSDGVIFSRRMVRDEEIRLKRAAGGYLGGNPSLAKMDNQKVNLDGLLSSRARAFDSDSYIPKSNSEKKKKDETANFGIFWDHYRKLRDAGRQQIAAQMWLSLDCEEHAEQVFVCLASYEASRDAQNGTVMNADLWLRTVHESGWTATWPAKKKSKLDQMAEEAEAM